MVETCDLALQLILTTFDSDIIIVGADDILWMLVSDLKVRYTLVKIFSGPKDSRFWTFNILQTEIFLVFFIIAITALPCVYIYYMM